MRVEANPHAPRISRSFLNGLKPDLGPLFDDVLLVVSELVTNSVRHGDGTKEVDVRVEANEGRIRLEVTDEGPCFDKDAPRGNGRGLYIIDRVSDRWGIDCEGHCTVWVEMSRV